MDLDKFNNIKAQYNKAKVKFDPYQEAMNSQVWSFIFEAGTEAERYFSEEFVYYARNCEDKTAYDLLRLSEVKEYLPGTINEDDYDISETDKTLTLGIGDGQFFAYYATFKYEELERYLKELRDLYHEWVVKVHKEKKAKKKQQRKLKAEKEGLNSDSTKNTSK